MRITNKKFLRPFVEVIIWLPLLIIFLGVIWQVFSRYILSVPSKYSEELIRFSLVYLTFLSGSYCFVIKRHIALDLLEHLLNSFTKKMLFFIQSAIFIIFSSMVLIYGGLSKAITQVDQVSTSFGISMFYIYLIIPLAGLVIFITTIVDIIRFFIKKEK